MSSTWKGGSTTAWRKLRVRILVRDNYQCKLRLDGCTTTAQCVHHILGKRITGDDPRYLVSACNHCNLKLGDPTKKPDPPSKGITRW